MQNDIQKFFDQSARDIGQNTISVFNSEGSLLAKLRIRKLLGLKIATLLCDPFIPYAQDIYPLLQSDKGLEQLLSEGYLKDIDFIKLRYLPNSATHKLTVKFHGLVRIKKLSNSVIDVSEGIKTNPFSTKSNRRNWKKLSVDGQLEFHEITNQTDRISCVNTLIAWKTEWLLRRFKLGISFHDNFHIHSLRKLASSDFKRNFRVFSLKQNGVCIALECGLFNTGTYLANLAAFNQKYHKFGVGNLLTFEIINHCKELEIARYDFLPPETPHKLKYGVNLDRVSEITLAVSRTAKFLTKMEQLLLR